MQAAWAKTRAFFASVPGRFFSLSGTDNGKRIGVRGVLAFAAVCAVLLLAAVPARAAGAPGLSFVSDGEPALRFSCWASPAGGDRYLYLPAGVSCADLTPVFSAETAEVDGQAIVSGEKTERFSGAGPFSVALDGERFRLVLLPASDLPAVLIETESGSLDAVHADKAHKEGGTLTVLEHGRPTLSAAPLAYIKGRGNSTWEQEKKPYNLKLESKADLLGMGASKKWCLLANAMDPTLLRNAAAYSLAQETAIPYTVEYRIADLFINGEYRGNYMLTEKVETGEGRVDIADLDEANAAANPGVRAETLQKTLTQPYAERGGKPSSYPGLQNYTPWPNEPADISGGYLLEFGATEAFAEADGGFVTERGNCLTLKSPEHVSQAEIGYIAGVYQAAEDAVLSGTGKNADGAHYSELLDLPSAADSYLLLEFTMDRDDGANSWFLYKEKNDPLLYAGPAWDFDISMERDDGVLTAGKTYFAAAAPARELTEKDREYGGGAIFRDLPRHREFWQLAYERWQPLAGYVKGPLTEELRRLRDGMADSAAADAVRWHGADPGSGRADWLAATEALFGFLSSRADTLSAGLADPDGALEQVRAARAGTGAKAPAGGGGPLLWGGAAVLTGAAAGCGAGLARSRKRKKGKKKRG